MQCKVNNLIAIPSPPSYAPSHLLLCLSTLCLLLSHLPLSLLPLSLLLSSSLLLLPPFPSPSSLSPPLQPPLSPLPTLWPSPFPSQPSPPFSWRCSCPSLSFLSSLPLLILPLPSSCPSPPSPCLPRRAFRRLLLFQSDPVTATPAAVHGVGARFTVHRGLLFTGRYFSWSTLPSHQRRPCCDSAVPPHVPPALFTQTLIAQGPHSHVEKHESLFSTAHHSGEGPRPPSRPCHCDGAQRWAAAAVPAAIVACQRGCVAAVHERRSRRRGAARKEICSRILVGCTHSLGKSAGSPVPRQHDDRDRC